jgi:Kef-type K+ transport system membrane component KefB
MHDTDLLSSIGIAIVAATCGALLARALRQPLILGYLLAGVLIGPEIGLGLVRDRHSIAVTAEIGLVLLLFIIGLEMDLQKLLGAGRALVVTGTVQFLGCVVLGLGFASLAGLSLGGQRFDGLYVAIGISLSSTMIVVKLLYDKFELMTLPGRITLGILVFQDVWAILVLALQPRLLSPSALLVAASLAKAIFLIVVSLLACRYVLPRVFASVAKVPELLLVTALAWCFLLSGLASAIGVSREMGALIAGVGMSTFPYNLDVIAKVINIRDFFVTLFFVALGMQIPVPTPSLLGLAALASAFLVLTRFLTVFPLLYVLRSGLRTSLLPAINLSQMSEFSLVIAALGLSLGHVQPDTVALLTLVFAITSVAGTYFITYNHQIQSALARPLERLGLGHASSTPEEHIERERALVFLGFYRDASAILHELEAAGGPELLEEVQVIDFNPVVLRELKTRNVASLYGDIASLDTLHHAAIHAARVVTSTITDSMLKGTTNLRLLRLSKKIAPEAAVIVTAETLPAARDLYAAGADYVFVPRMHSGREMAHALTAALQGQLGVLRDEAEELLATRNEVLP